jgi:hypothetical protein
MKGAQWDFYVIFGEREIEQIITVAFFAKKLATNAENGAWLYEGAN